MGETLAKQDKRVTSLWMKPRCVWATESVPRKPNQIWSNLFLNKVSNLVNKV